MAWPGRHATPSSISSPRRRRRLAAARSEISCGTRGVPQLWLVQRHDKSFCTCSSVENRLTNTLIQGGRDGQGPVYRYDDMNTPVEAEGWCTLEDAEALDEADPMTAETTRPRGAARRVRVRDRDAVPHPGGPLGPKGRLAHKGSAGGSTTKPTPTAAIPVAPATDTWPMPRPSRG